MSTSGNKASGSSKENTPLASIYCLLAKTVDELMEALRQDLLPDEATGLVLGMKGNGRLLYCAFQGMMTQGRMSRTMLEQAMCYTPTSYREYITLWIRSLPPESRSQYVASLYQNNFQNLPWDTDPKFPNYFNQIATLWEEGDEEVESEFRRLQPPQPLGDNRHDPRPAKAARLAKDFYNLFRYGLIFNGPESVPNLNVDDPESLDVLIHFGSSFGIDSELPWEDAFSAFPIRMLPEVITVSDLMLRTWNALYYNQRLSLTEIECALIHGNMREFLTRAVSLALDANFKGKAFAQRGRGHFRKVINFLKGDYSSLEGDTASTFQLVFTELTVDESIDESCLECDFCGSQLEKPQKYSQCKTAMYCNRTCQKNDWTGRHKALCSSAH